MHGEKQELDWLQLAAVAYKESTLNPAARGASGATGLMQITPAAARSVGVGNIQVLDNNVLAATRYMARIRREFFASRQIGDSVPPATITSASPSAISRPASPIACAPVEHAVTTAWFGPLRPCSIET